MCPALVAASDGASPGSTANVLRRGLGLRRLPGVRDGGAGTADPRALFEDYARRGDGLLGPPRPRAGPGSRRAGTTTRRRRLARIPVVVACALRPPRASPTSRTAASASGGFHPGHDAYCQGRYLADNIASWALAGLLVQAHGRQRPDVAVACADACRREGAVRALARSPSQRSSPPFVGAATRSGCGWVRTRNWWRRSRPRTPRRRSSTRCSPPPRAMHAADGGAGFRAGPGLLRRAAGSLWGGRCARRSSL